VADAAPVGDAAAAGAAPAAAASAAAKPKRRRRRGGRRAKGADAGAAGPQQTASGEAEGGQPRGGQRQGGQQQGAARKPRRSRVPRQPREKGPLPFAQLRAAAEGVTAAHGGRRALRDAFTVLGQKERADLARLIAEDGDWRIRSRNIAAGSLGAGRLGKAIAAQQISMAAIEDLWSIVLSKEEAAARQARVRDARQRDERRQRRQAERRSSGDRVSRDELAKAQDGRVGASVRIVLDEPRDRKGKKGKGEPRPATTDDLLSRLGY
jgi:hypothetical protein